MRKSHNEAIICLDIKDKEECPKIDPFGLCTVTDCLGCNNCDYMIVLADGKVLKEFSKDNSSEKYLVQFFDAITSDLKKYLLDETNDYRITRLSDGVVLRYSNDDLILMGMEPRKKQAPMVKEEAKTFIKKFKDSFKRCKTPC